MSRVLVVTDVAATSQYAGGTVLKSVLDQLPKDWLIDQLVIGNPSLKYNLNELNRGSVTFTQKPNAQWHGARSKTLAGVFQNYVRAFEVPTIRKLITKKYSETEYDWVLLAISCQVLTEAVNKVDFWRSRTASFMWDDPSWFAREHLLSRKVSARFVRQWFEIQNSVDRLILPSENAKSLFPARNEKTNLVLYPYICESVGKSDGSVPERVRVGFAGSQYADEEIFKFLTKLSNSKFDKKVPYFEFHAFSKVEPKPAVSNLRYRHWHSPEETRDLLSELDFAYLPYPFHKDMATVVKTSFPSKLSLYLASGLPIIYHGPEDSAVWKFLESNNCGTLLDMENFVKSLELSLEKRQSLQINAAETFKKHFSKRVFAARVREVFDIDSDQEVPVSVADLAPPTNRVQTLNWSDLKDGNVYPQASGLSQSVDFIHSVSLSKYLYLILRPDIVKQKITQVNLTQSLGTFLTRSGILVFGLISKFFVKRIKSKASLRDLP